MSAASHMPSRWRRLHTPASVSKETILAGSPLTPRDALGLIFEVRCLDPELSSYVGRLLVGLPRAVGADVAMQFEIEAVPRTEFDSIGKAVETLISNLNLGAIGAAEGNLLFHAGAACGPLGEVVVICGPSGSGKSTLTARLVESGLAYLTDEVTCIDPIDLSLTPFRKPLSLKPGSQQLFAHLKTRFDAVTVRFTDDVWLIPFTDLGGMSLPRGPLQPRILIFPEYSAGEQLRLHRLSPGEAAFALGSNSSRLRQVRGTALPALARLVAQAPAYRIVHSDVNAAAEQVRELLAA